MDRQTIYISSYPKSGSTWLTRLLADVLNSPSGGCMPEEDVKEIATEGQDRPGPYIVRKGHFVLVGKRMKAGRFRDVDNPAVPSPHRLDWSGITDERVIFLVRDPRDVCISGAYHWHITPEQFLDRMIKGNVARCGRWDKYYNQAIIHNIFMVSYEQLSGNTLAAVNNILAQLGLKAGGNIWEAINRQSFTARAAGKDEAELRRNNMRKGVVGDWRNHFTPAMNERMWNEFGWMMERLGYEIN